MSIKSMKEQLDRTEELPRLLNVVKTHMDILAASPGLFSSREKTASRRKLVITLNTVSYAMCDCITILQRQPRMFLQSKNYHNARPADFEAFYCEALMYCQKYSTAAHMFDVVLFHDRLNDYNNIFKAAVERFGVNGDQPTTRIHKHFWCLELQTAGRKVVYFEPTNKFVGKDDFLKSVLGDDWINEVENSKECRLYRLEQIREYEPLVSKTAAWEPVI